MRTITTRVFGVFRSPMLFVAIVAPLACGGSTSSPDSPDAGASPVSNANATACKCDVCNGDSCRGSAAGCASDELCIAAEGGRRCARYCGSPASTCAAGTTCQSVMDCDTPLQVCK